MMLSAAFPVALCWTTVWMLSTIIDGYVITPAGHPPWHGQLLPLVELEYEISWPFLHHQETKVRRRIEKVLDKVVPTAGSSPHHLNVMYGGTEGCLFGLFPFIPTNRRMKMEFSIQCRTQQDFEQLQLKHIDSLRDVASAKINDLIRAEQSRRNRRNRGCRFLKAPGQQPTSLKVDIRLLADPPSSWRFRAWKLIRRIWPGEDSTIVAQAIVERSVRKAINGDKVVQNNRRFGTNHWDMPYGGHNATKFEFWDPAVAERMMVVATDAIEQLSQEVGWFEVKVVI